MAGRKPKPRSKPNGNRRTQKVDLLGMVQDIASLKSGKIGWVVGTAAYVGLVAFMLVYVNLGLGQIDQRLRVVETTQVQILTNQQQFAVRQDQFDKRLDAIFDNQMEILKRLPPAN